MTQTTQTAGSVNLETLLVGFSQHFSLGTVPVNEHHRARLIFDDTIDVVIAERSAREDVVLFSEIGKITVATPTETLVSLLAANHQCNNPSTEDEPSTIQPSLTLHKKEQAVVLRDNRLLSTLCPERFGTWLDTFVAYAAFWQEALTRPADPQIEATTNPVASEPSPAWTRC